MTSCRQFEDDLWEAATAQIISPALEEHIRNCQPCARSLRALSLAARGLSALRKVEAPDPSAAVRERLARGGASRRRRLAPALVAGAAICSLALAVLLMLTHGASPPTRRTTSVPTSPLPAVRARARTQVEEAQAKPSVVSPSQPVEVKAPAMPVTEPPTMSASRAKPEPAPFPVAPRMPPPAPAESGLQAPCHQVTMFVLRPAAPVRPLYAVANPNYRVLVEPQIVSAPDAGPQYLVWTHNL